MLWMKKISFILGMAVLAVLLFACGGTSGSSGSTASTPGATHSSDMMASDRLVQNGQYSDERFIDMMVPHHMMAVQMAQVAQQKGEHPEIKQLAASIISSQDQEIQELKNLKKSLYGTSDTPTMMNDTDMANTGMMMPNQLAGQQPFDKAFIYSMIPHHASAIDMASVALMRSTNSDIKRIARAIVDAQSQEIGKMIQWRQQWYPNSTALSVGSGVANRDATVMPRSL